MRSQKIIQLADLAAVIENERQAGRTIALCHGVFDLLHPGHFRHLSSAKSHADILVVTITADRYVGKGPGRPVFDENLRAESLASLEAVDYVSVVDDAVAVPAIEAVHPSFYVKGQEYASSDGDVTGNIDHEKALVERFGGRLIFTDDVVFSSSSLINAFMPQHGESTRAWLQSMRDEYGVDEVLQWINRIGDLRVVVVGEAILDLYTECQTLGKASKEPVLCLNRGETETHGGGVLAIAGHCAGLGAQVDLITGLNSHDVGCAQVRRLEDTGARIHIVTLDPRPTIRKERLIDATTQSRVLEIYTMDDTPLAGEAERELLAIIDELVSRVDVTLVADYGHGFLPDAAVARICAQSSFLAVNAQTNAGNHGFNSLGRYPRAGFATLNGNEARLEARRRHVDFDAYIPTLRDSLGASAVLVTQGAAGLDLYLANGARSRSPALAPFVKDRVGAGDAVLATTSLLMAVGAPPRVVGFVGNLVGAWAVSFLGNEQTLNLGQLKRQVSAILK